MIFYSIEEAEQFVAKSDVPAVTKAEMLLYMSNNKLLLENK